MRVSPFAALLLVLTALLLGLSVDEAKASEIIGRNAQAVTLKVNGKGEALATFRSGGKVYRVLVWGAINARPPSRAEPQVKLRVDYAGGWGRYRRDYWRSFKGACGRYDGPALPRLVIACKSPDGSYWALQSWQRLLPNLGVPPWLASQRAYELHVSHWRGPLPQLELYADWVQWGSRYYHKIFGRFTYLGRPIHGFNSTPTGVPLDSYGRNVYLDTRNSALGPGWRRENGFLANNPTGMFCYGLYEREPYAGYPKVGRRPEANGDMYRVTAIGPGVTPIVQSPWVQGLPDYDPENAELVAHEQQMNAISQEMAAGGQACTRD